MYRSFFELTIHFLLERHLTVKSGAMVLVFDHYISVSNGTEIRTALSQKVQCPGGRPEAKMLKFRIDRQVTVFLNLLLKFVKRFTVGQVIKFIVRAY